MMVSAPVDLIVIGIVADQVAHLISSVYEGLILLSLQLIEVMCGFLMGHPLYQGWMKQRTMQ